ncbi:MAG: aspartate ammonia-lyase [Clostridia bacterium]|nr:aspartate ammonia-lyase [Clostridia bacterium]
MSKISAILSGVSGEHFVAAELSRRGYIASLTSKNTKGIDLLASNEDASKTIGIQVKTNQGSRKAWLLNEKCEEFYSDTLHYVFVNLNGTGTPDYYIVPSTIVAEYIKKAHQNWLDTPGKSGKPHKDTAMRMFHD